MSHFYGQNDVTIYVSHENNRRYNGNVVGDRTRTLMNRNIKNISEKWEKKTKLIGDFGLEIQ